MRMHVCVYAVMQAQSCVSTVIKALYIFFSRARKTSKPASHGSKRRQQVMWPEGVRPAAGARGAGSRTASREQGLCHPTAAWEEEATKDQSALIFDSSASAA
jgi:hypothetical protein